MNAKIIAQEGILRGVISSSKTLKAKVSTSLPDGGYEKGYSDGYAKGNENGYAEGYTEGEKTGYESGLAARKYELWTITLVDGTIVEKEVALL